MFQSIYIDIGRHRCDEICVCVTSGKKGVFFMVTVVHNISISVNVYTNRIPIYSKNKAIRLALNNKNEHMLSLLCLRKQRDPRVPKKPDQICLNT